MTQKSPTQLMADLEDQVRLLRSDVKNLAGASLSKEDARLMRNNLVDKHNQITEALETQGQQNINLEKEALRLATEATREAVQSNMAQIERETLRLARELSKATGEARSQAWRYFGGFWVWIVSMLASGALLGVLATIWLQGRADAIQFGEAPAWYCETAGGKVTQDTNNRDVCVFWLDQR